MLLAHLVATSHAVTATTKRTLKTERLAEVLTRAVEERDDPNTTDGGFANALLCVSYLSGQVRQTRLGIGHAAVAGLRVASAPESSLTLRTVDETLEQVAGRSGAGATKAKRTLLEKLFAAATSDEQRFLGALLLGELRQGALEGLLLDAVSRVSRVPLGALRRALLVRGDFAQIAATAMVSGEQGLAKFRLRLFQPLAPMLAQPGESVTAALSEGDMQAEYKLDGARVQVHKCGNEVRVFSRLLNDVTAAVPEIVHIVSALPAHSLILDGEALALQADGRPFPFQDTMRRFGRKNAVPETLLKELPLACFFFDLLHVDGQDVFHQPYRERQELLDGVTSDHRVPRCEVREVADVERMFTLALDAGHEGLVLKALASSYEPGRRGSTWLKLKPVHTLDLVVLAAEWGSGRRKGTLSNLHLGARSDDGFVMLGKTFKGLTDELLAFQTRELLARETRKEGHIVHVRPELVVEIAFDGVQRSSQYAGGVALRFARVKRYRPDKSPAEADTLEQVTALLPAASAP